MGSSFRSSRSIRVGSGSAGGLPSKVAEDDLGTPHMVRAHCDLGGGRREQRWWERSAEAPETIDQVIPGGFTEVGGPVVGDRELGGRLLAGAGDDDGRTVAQACVVSAQAEAG
jgi:hypothetical protein